MELLAGDDPMAVLTTSQAMPAPPDKLAPLRNHPLFGQLPPRVIEHLGSYVRNRGLARGDTIFSKGDSGSGLMAVLSGSVRISVPSVDGRDIMLRIIHPGEIFGEISLLDGRPRTADATAMADCELMVIERRDFIPFFRSQPDLIMQMLEILCFRLRWTTEQVQDVSFLNLPTRLAKALLRLAENQTAAPGNGKLTITQRELSQLIGRSRESTNKQLRIWEKRGWVRLQRGALILLQPDRLVEVMTEAAEIDPS